MRGSITIATIFGTKVRMHLTFLILLAWVAAGEGLTRGAQAAATGTIFVLLLFACVVAHEFGHVLVARHYGGRTRDILLLPIGGVSRMERMPERPAQELAVAIAGPMVSIAIGVVLIALAGFPRAQSIESPALEALLPRLAATNLFLALFNLLPAFPMDGGRALRALLTMRMGRISATRIAARFGHIIAGLFVLVGLISANPILLLIGIFIYFGATAEAADTELRQVAQTMTVSDVMRSNVRTIRSSAPLSDGIELMLRAGQHAIPVIGPDGTLAGVATKDSIIRAVHRSGRGAAISEAVTADVPVIGSHQRLADALDLMQSHSVPAVVVVDSKGELSGMLTSETLSDLMIVQPSFAKRNSQVTLPHARVSVPSSG
jgi:stage IV sporulation protein FB